MTLSAHSARIRAAALLTASLLVTPLAPAQQQEGATGSAQASSLRDLLVTAMPDGGDRIVLTLDQEPRFQVQEVEDPYRLVIDLEGTVNRLPKNVRAVNSDQVQRVRTAQYQTVPEPVARVVLDMKG